jgi:hypothetical protein
MGFFDTVQLRILLSYTGCFQKVKEPLSFCTRRSFTIKYRIDVVKALALPNGNCSKFAPKLRLTAQQNVESVLIATLTRALMDSHYGKPKVSLARPVNLVRSPAEPIAHTAKMPGNDRLHRPGHACFEKSCLGAVNNAF